MLNGMGSKIFLRDIKFFVRVLLTNFKRKREQKKTYGHQPPVRIELTTPGLQDQCSNH